MNGKHGNVYLQFAANHIRHLFTDFSKTSFNNNLNGKGTEKKSY